MTIFTKNKNDYFTKISWHLMDFLAPNAHKQVPKARGETEAWRSWVIDCIGLHS